ncbi:MAG: hypothetical protein PHW72_01250 [Candidatus Pacebacteria bacterium]|nr:hypothetical protein [Candidatus Paceibacterota bacterium]
MQKSQIILQNGFSYKFWLVLLFLAAFILFIFSIIHVNVYTGSLYSIQTFEDRINQLNEENRTLEINFTKANSLNNLTSYVQNQTFQKISNIKYVRVLESTALAK